MRRSATAVRQARATSSRAVCGEWTRSGTAPTAAAIAAWSIRKLERTAAAAVSPATTSSGVPLFAASAMPVTALVRPGPWWTLTTPRPPLTRA
ncbi:Uncharacterised protein [Mycobacterium tuberculosis]|nr:Uncharacterised protein [Mycobacterium tuberculosis]